MEMFYPKGGASPYPVRVVYYGPTSLIVEEEGNDYVLTWNSSRQGYEGKLGSIEGCIYE